MKSIKQFIFRLILIGAVCFGLLLIYSDGLIQQQFAKNRWLVPAKVYASPLLIMTGESVSLERFLQELDALAYRSTIKLSEPGQFQQFGTEFDVYLRGFAFAEGFVPARKLRVIFEGSRLKSSQLLPDNTAHTQSVFDLMRFEPRLIGRINPVSEEDRELVNLKEVPRYLVDALLVSEDRDFYHHHGISLRGIARAFGQNISSGKIAQGGSTLTQQLVKNYFLTNEKTLWRKIREAVMSLVLEFRYNKDDILQAYMNEVYLGQDGKLAIHGFARASKYYFDRELSELNLNQAATLVGIVRGPSYYDPYKYGERAKERRNLILEQMHEHDRITQKEMESAQAKSLQIVTRSKRRQSQMPAVMGMVRKQLKEHYTFAQLNHDDLTIFTSIDPFIQEQAENSLSRHIDRITTYSANVPKELQGAMMVSHRLSGDILAVVGDKNPHYEGFNRAINAYRQTGSAIKPFVYLTALQRPEKYTLQSIVLDKKFSLTATDGSEWNPENYDRLEYGEVTLFHALSNSLNLATSRLALSIGLEHIVKQLYQAGFNRELYAFPSLALGAQEMSVWELLRLYQVLASGGLKMESKVVQSVIDSRGQLLEHYGVIAERVVPEEPIYLLNLTLQNVVREGTAKSLPTTLKSLKVAGKTGTTNDLKDSWFAGFSEQYLAVSWVGLDENQSTGLTGASGAMKIWADLINHIETKPLVLIKPEGIVLAKQGWFGDCIPFVQGYLPDDYSECD